MKEGETPMNEKKAMPLPRETVEYRKKRHDVLTNVTNRLSAMESRVEAMGNAGAIVVPIQCLSPEPFEVIKEIKAVVRPADYEFVASFFDANVNASGCNENEAVENLKEMLVSRFEQLDALPPKKLGPGPARQIAVLREFIRRKR